MKQQKCCICNAIGIQNVCQNCSTVISLLKDCFDINALSTFKSIIERRICELNKYNEKNFLKSRKRGKYNPR